MKQIVQSARSGELVLKDVPDARVRRGHILVRTRSSLISAGTERMVVNFAKKNLLLKAKERPDLVRKVLDKTRRDGIGSTVRAVLARLDEPLPLGYSACGDVVAVGDGVEGKFHVGQRVAISGAGLANHAELNAIPINLAAPVPDDVSDEEACFGTLGTIALHGVRNAQLQFGDCAAVIGAGLVGQIAAQLLELSGVRVVILDYNQDRLALATSLGAELACNLANGDPSEPVLEFTEGRGCDGVLIAAATDSSEPFNLAANLARDRAIVSLVGITGTEIPYREFMQKELSVVVSRSYGPGRYDSDYENRGMKYPVGWVPWTETRNLEEVVRRMSPSRAHRLNMGDLITHHYDFSEIEEAYGLVTKNTEPHLGVVLKYGDTSSDPVERLGGIRSNASSTGQCVLGVIGAGSFARTVLLPKLKQMSDCRLHTIATQRGISSEHAQNTFGFEFSTSDEETIFGEDEINAVLIATPHSSHARLTAAALVAGKCVFVEKPLALDRDQLNSVIAARRSSSGFFQIGFNRRFAPMAVQMRAKLTELPAPYVLMLRINAGQLPQESWQNAAEEGNGRILGEMCHFVDLARYLVGSPIVSVHAEAARVTRDACDDVVATLKFADGSVASITYTAKGDTSFSKELFEAYAGGTVITIDNFRSISVTTDGRQRKQVARIDQDKGHKQQLLAFTSAVATGLEAPVNEQELVETSLATIAINESLQTGLTVEL